MVTPGSGIKGIDAIRTNEHAERGAQNDLIDIELVACVVVRQVMKGQ